VVDALTADAFERIKQLVLRDGDRRTYCNMYNGNPHLEVDGFHAYLNPAAGQANLDCDPTRSDFDEIVIRDQRATPQYVQARVEGGRLVFDAAHAVALARYFSALLARANLDS
jgi:hypothetical protein